MVLAELFWLLDQRYKYPRNQQLALLRQLLQLTNLVVEAPGDVHSAADLYAQHNVQFADCLIAVRNRRTGCEATYRFDREAGGRFTHP